MVPTAKFSFWYLEITLRVSRVKGVLAGIEAPPYIKMGRIIQYEKADLDKWKAQFVKITNTAQPTTST